MNKVKAFQTVVMTVLILLLVGCGSPTNTPVPQAPTAAPTQEPPAPTATSVPATDAPTPEPPAATATPEPPTATSEPPTSTSEPPTPTSEPPTATPEPPTATPIPELVLSSPAFESGGPIPEEYSCFGDNVSPALDWSGIPGEAQSLLLLVTDPDAGADSGASTELGFAHWIVYNIPPDTSGYAEDAPAGETLADGAQQGSNDFGQFVTPGDPFPGDAPIKVVGYDGPCPGGEHRYAFTLYALDAALDLSPGAVLADVLAAMESHVLAQAEIVGLFAPPQ